ncbi:uncharacterized protein DUF1848 [Halanaerobium saccharolyticum]|uniref:Uncharacterized protein DUF1848 n=1 Tax=Halanaerobium saccharolyticum TaxID=43595 RepID=A0A4R7YSP1_9FIRM|nr:DUF1848 domain-containing protein [Halanaerobium saccharolyticum]RAK06309.1 uncharacterized protein DUF1848 [Halanaerobium saccharolyticum]TDW00788.1 uncharacterized protein DUF1848 [Halanaerobium saccharolyticum]TDX52430.1 uncharacterized protein DUF1848 [Halanaerobium saccharolyticum]
MIISASRRTDIPAFYSKWFINRIREGFFFQVNPYNQQQKGISLAPEAVEAFVFWSKYPRPLLKYLPELDHRGYNYYFQFTLNNYPELLESRLPSLEARISAFKELSQSLGKERVIWRYDPIIISSLTPPAYHLQQFSQLAAELKDSSSRVVISFLDFYGKTKSRLKKLEQENGISFRDLVKAEAELLSFCRSLKEIAEANDFEIQSCGEMNNDSARIIPPGKCIDDQLLNQLFDLKLPSLKDPGQRQSCLCIKAAEMGVYNSCQFDCVYCYASRGPDKIRERIDQHNPESPVLIGEAQQEFKQQLSLFNKKF